MWVYNKGVTSYCEVTPLLYDKLYTKKNEMQSVASLLLERKTGLKPATLSLEG